MAEEEAIKASSTRPAAAGSASGSSTKPTAADKKATVNTTASRKSTPNAPSSSSVSGSTKPRPLSGSNKSQLASSSASAAGAQNAPKSQARPPPPTQKPPSLQVLMNSSYWYLDDPDFWTFFCLLYWIIYSIKTFVPFNLLSQRERKCQLNIVYLCLLWYLSHQSNITCKWFFGGPTLTFFRPFLKSFQKINQIKHQLYCDEVLLLKSWPSNISVFRKQPQLSWKMTRPHQTEPIGHRSRCQMQEQEEVVLPSNRYFRNCNGLFIQIDVHTFDPCILDSYFGGLDFSLRLATVSSSKPWSSI